MSKRLIVPLLSLIFLLAACSSWSSSPNFPICEASHVSQDCGYPTDWIALSAPTEEMEMLREDGQAITYVNIGAHEDLPKSDSPLAQAEEIVVLARSGDLAVYDKLHKCYVTSIGIVDYSEQWTLDPETGISSGMHTIGLYLSDCTPILEQALLWD